MTVADIAGRLGAALEGGDPDAPINGLAGIREAGDGDLSFLADARYRGQAASTRATALLVNADFTETSPAALLRVASAEEAFMQVAGWFATPPEPDAPGVHATAVIGEAVDLGQGVCIGPHCVVGNACCLGDGTVLTAHCVLGHHVTLGRDCRLYPMVSIREHCRIGDRTILHNGVVVGSDGFGYLPGSDGWRKIPQTGTVVVGDDVEVGANTTIDRARFGVTRIGNGVKIDNLVQVAHNVTLGDRSAVAGMTAFAGSVTVGKRVRIGGCAAIAGHLTVGDDAVLAGRAGVTRDVPPRQFVSGFPAQPHDRELRQQALVMRLPELRKQVAQLERRLQQLEQARP